jgi:hypothetical protein
MTDQAYDEREDEQEARRDDQPQQETRDEDESEYGRTPENQEDES